MENLIFAIESVSGCYFPEFEPLGMCIDDRTCEVDDVGEFVMFW